MVHSQMRKKLPTLLTPYPMIILSDYPQGGVRRVQNRAYWRDVVKSAKIAVCVWTNQVFLGVEHLYQSYNVQLYPISKVVESCFQKLEMVVRLAGF